MIKSRSIGIAMSFVGLLVGAGFATGQEVVQYFTSFGFDGIWGIIVAGAIMTLAGTVFLQLGSYFHASEHNTVFRQVTHPIISKLLDVSVIITLFSIGFVMLAGAGSNMQQQFGWPTWAGSTLMLVLVLACGFLDVDKVSAVIGAVTPTIIIAVAFVGVYTAMHMPADPAGMLELSAHIDSPVSHWLVSALNYNGLALILAVSMSLVIGGDHLDPREAGWGGLWGGIIYTVLMGVAFFALLMNADKVGKSDIPMLYLLDSIHPALGFIMSIIIFLMIFNTAIGMFYALGKRLSAGREDRYLPIFIGGCLAGYAVSFFGFKTLMAYVYPVIGYIGMFMVVVLVVAWVKSLNDIKDESRRRERIKALLSLKLRPDYEYDEAKDAIIGREISGSNMDDEVLFDEALGEVADDLHNDEAVNFDAADFDADSYDVKDYTEHKR
ncbi:hypothetical protein QVA66_11165 [Staphylococcus chromogenes]|nr:hypothetical protein [Staphylococcus chromogenes]